MSKGEDMKISGINTRDKSTNAIAFNNYLDQISLFEKLKDYLPRGTGVLEINAVPEFPREAMNAYFNLTLTVDHEDILRQFEEQNSSQNILQLRPDEILSDVKYDCVYSNKGMVGLNKREFQASLMGQIKALKTKGLVCHTFWKGSGTEHYLNKKCYYHLEEELIDKFSGHFEILELATFSDTTRNDSILLIGRKK